MDLTAETIISTISFVHSRVTSLMPQLPCLESVPTRWEPWKTSSAPAPIALRNGGVFFTWSATDVT